MRNVRLAFRALFRTPFVTGTAILSLALGIGANTAIFSLFDRILLRPLPVHEPDRLVNLSAPGPKPGSTSCNQAGDCEDVFSYPMFRDLEAARTGLAGLAAHVGFGANLAFEDRTLNGAGMLVSGSYFPLLGLRPALGRLFGRDDDRTIGAHDVVVLGHAFWEAQAGGRPDVVGESIVVNGRTMAIVGVAPRGFEGTTLGSQPMVYVPLTMRGAVIPGFTGFEDRRSYWAYVFARLGPGTTRAQAAASLNASYRAILADVEAPLQQGMSETTMARFLAKEVVLTDGRRGQSTAHRNARMPLALLFVTTGIVLLIACANIANLLLARGANRSMEMAVRLSLGAGRGRVLGQLLAESVVLAGLGGIASLLVARWTLVLIASILPAGEAGIVAFELRPSVLLFAATISVGTGLLFGMFPALHSTRPDLVSTIRANAGSIMGARGAARFRSGLVIAQIALSMTLLSTAGLFIRSLLNVSRVDLGLDAENVIAFRISPQLNGYEPERSRVLFARVEEELATLPGVTAVTASSVPLLASSNWGQIVSVDGFERGPDTDASARFSQVGPGYFGTLGIPFIDGRDFAAGDDAGTLKVAVVNEAFARKFGLGRDAVGRYMGLGDSLDMQIVGLAANAKYSEVKDEVPPQFFVPYRQQARVGSLSFYVRVTGDARGIMRAVPPVIARLDPNLPVQDLKTLPQQVRENVALDRMISTLSAAFAALATLLAAVGLYGVLAYAVAQRTREIGVRMALGADAGRVRGMVLGQVARMLGIGGAVGIAAALALGRAAASLLFGLEGHDPAVIAGAAALLSAFALVAGFMPARRASRVDPMGALRYE